MKINENKKGNNYFENWKNRRLESKYRNIPLYQYFV